MDSEVTIRVADVNDVSALLDIYRYYVEQTAITYDYELPTVEEFTEKMVHTLKTYPYLVAELNGRIVGYAYASRFQSRSGYNWDAEMTIYVDVNSRGHRVGQKLYTLLEQILKEQGVVKEIALVTPPDDEFGTRYNSMHFHEKMGYRLVGKIEPCGFKFNRWFNTIIMDKIINEPTENMKSIKTFNEVREKFGL